MDRLIDDISLFLEHSGIGCSRQMLHGFEVICVETSGSKADKVILPLEIKADTPEEAQADSRTAEEALNFIKPSGGYPLIISEDRWNLQKEMMQARLLAHLEIFTSVFARNCEVRRIEKTDAVNFLTANHSYGYAACRYHYGLFDRKDGTLIAVATFSNARKWIKGSREIRSYEWTRYASLPGMRISGGMGKLLKTFIKEVNPDDIMSYADLEWSEGEVYKALGFIREGGKEPVDFIINPESWERTAIGKNRQAHGSAGGRGLYFRNFGSAKYRLKLTEYE